MPPITAEAAIEPATAAKDFQQPSVRPVIVRSEELLGNARELWIQHGDSMYRLRRTASGKLYLTK